MTEIPVGKGRKSTIDIQIGKRLKNQRCLAGLSQSQLGKMCGLTFQQIQKYEKGIDRIAASRLYQLADRLGVPIEYFFEALDDKVESSEKHKTAGEASLHKRESMNLLNAYYQITDGKKRRKVYELIRSIAETN